jgi:serine/threonine protein phosphatase 1
MARDLTFAVADLHGRFDLLAKALEAIDAYGAGAKTSVVFLGDYIDRGPESCQVIERLRDGPSADAVWIYLKGNHEDMMAQAGRDPSLMPWWIRNGGVETLASYHGSGISPGDHLAWVENLPCIHVDRHRVFVHAGVDPAVPLSAQNDKVLMMKRYPHGVAEGHGHHHVVHGHHPHEDGPLLYAGRTALDTLAWRTGRLVVGVFDNEVPGGPVDLIEVRGAHGPQPN